MLCSTMFGSTKDRGSAPCYENEKYACQVQCSKTEWLQRNTNRARWCKLVLPLTFHMHKTYMARPSPQLRTFASANNIPSMSVRDTKFLLQHVLCMHAVHFSQLHPIRAAFITSLPAEHSVCIPCTLHHGSPSLPITQYSSFY